MAITKDFLTALYSRFSSTSTGARTHLYSDVSGRMYLSDAPQNATLPYIIYELVDDRQDWQFGRNYRRLTVSFDQYSSVRSTTEITKMMHDLDALFDNRPLSSTGFTRISCNREFSQLSKLIDEVSNTPIWWALHQYQVVISTT